MNFLVTFLVGKGARLIQDASMRSIKDAESASKNAAAERQAALQRERAERLQEIQEPQAITFVPASAEAMLEAVIVTLPVWLWGGTPPCSYCSSPLNLILAQPPQIRWTRLFKRPPPGARDMRILVQDGWTVHGSWQVDCAPCTSCSLQHESRVGDFPEIAP